MIREFVPLAALYRQIIETVEWKTKLNSTYSVVSNTLTE